MASEHDRELVARITAGDVRGLLTADDPAAVLDAAGRTEGTVAVDDLAGGIAAARVRLAEVVVARARRAEADQLAAVAPRAPSAADHATPADGRDDDRQAVRFSLAVLLPALVGGAAVYVADGLLLAVVLPAVALAALGVVVLRHRRLPTSDPGATETDPPTVPVEVGDGPAVRAAEAHLRRQQAAWKLVWWEREEPVPDLASWSPRLAATAPITLVSVDVAGRLDADAHAAMTAAAPAAIRVVVLQARG
ncbi:MAG TPA: hypothetical protein VLR27_11610 [Acidimicrobiales bacterium]|nr:hypothetical protein [Acidimicrobiales bacterium]